MCSRRKMLWMRVYTYTHDDLIFTRFFASLFNFPLSQPITIHILNILHIFRSIFCLFAKFSDCFASDFFSRSFFLWKSHTIPIEVSIMCFKWTIKWLESKKNNVKWIIWWYYGRPRVSNQIQYGITKMPQTLVIRLGFKLVILSSIIAWIVHDSCLTFAFYDAIFVTHIKYVTRHCNKWRSIYYAIVCIWSIYQRTHIISHKTNCNANRPSY